MAMRTYKTGTITMTGATSNATLTDVTGRIKSITIKPSGTSTDFKVSISKEGVTEYMLGASGSSVSVAAAGQVFYPLAVGCGTDGVDYDPSVSSGTGDGGNPYTDFVASHHTITIEVSAGASDETYAVEIVVEED